MTRYHKVRTKVNQIGNFGDYYGTLIKAAVNLSVPVKSIE